MTQANHLLGCPTCGGTVFIVQEIRTHRFVMKGSALVFDDTDHSEHGDFICETCTTEVDELRFLSVRW